MTDGIVNVKKCGALGDGVTDDTAALQQALTLAGEVSGQVLFPPGIYCTSCLHVPSHVMLQAAPTWSYRQPGGTILRLCDPTAAGLLDLTGSIGARISGLSLDGARLGTRVCGVYFDGDGHEQEDSVVIEQTRITNFTGDGIRLMNVWEFSIRNSLVIYNLGDGLAYTRWDGFIIDTMFSGNDGYGIAAYAPNASVTMTANRIEWNKRGGLLIESGGQTNVTGNYFDRSGGPAITVRGSKERPCGRISITGNVLHRSGAEVADDAPESCHAAFSHVCGLAFTGNTLSIGVDDGGDGHLSPAVGVTYQELTDAVIANNVLYHAAHRQLFVEQGNNESVICESNPGTLYIRPEG